MTDKETEGTIDYTNSSECIAGLAEDYNQRITTAINTARARGTYERKLADRHDGVIVFHMDGDAVIGVEGVYETRADAVRAGMRLVP